MSESGLGRALHDRFEAIRRSEIDRLAKKKLSGLTDDQRRLIDGVTAELVRALAVLPTHALARHPEPAAAAALVQLFGL